MYLMVVVDSHSIILWLQDLTVPFQLSLLILRTLFVDEFVEARMLVTLKHHSLLIFVCGC